VHSSVGGDLTIRVSNATGSGELTAVNASWSCSTRSPWSIRCSGQNGQVLLRQAGVERLVPVVVRVTDRSGATYTRVVTPT
jgi:hypothetical protein